MFTNELMLEFMQNFSVVFTSFCISYDCVKTLSTCFFLSISYQAVMELNLYEIPVKLLLKVLGMLSDTAR